MDTTKLVDTVLLTEVVAKLAAASDPLTALFDATKLAGVSLNSLAMHFGCSRQALHKWFCSGRLPADRVSTAVELAWIILYAVHTQQIRPGYTGRYAKTRVLDVLVPTIQAKGADGIAQIKKVLLGNYKK